MLSRAAGNALLKTLEEPPEHVVFVLATTEPYKLLDTIRSRSQRFDFHPVSSETLVDYLGVISDREGFTSDQPGLAMIATHARGSVRDAMSLLEQVAALGDGVVSSEGVTRALGLADGDAFTGLVAAISNQDAPAALGLVAQLASRGADLRRFVADSLGFFRGIFLAQYAPNLEEITDEPPEILDEWRRQARVLSPADVLRAIDRFAEALLHLRQGREERLVLELALIRLTRPETTIDGESLASRIERLERGMRAGAAAGATGHQLPAAGPEPTPVPLTEGRRDTEERGDDAGGQAASAQTEAVEMPIPDSVAPGTRDALPARELTLAAFSAIWPVAVARVRSDFGARRHAFVRVAEPLSVDGSTAVLTLPAHQHFHLEQLNADDELLRALEATTAELLGAQVTLRFQSDDDTTSAPALPVEPSRAPDQDQLEDGPGRQGPEDLIVDMLGGKVVEE
jgi:DNA polymerase III gamma/tau subunit